jgi:NTE family protein
VKADAVFEGGGVKGIGLVGAVCCMEEYGYSWEKLAGTSAGAIVASLLSVGYSGKELKEIMMDFNYLLFLDQTKLQAIPLLGKPISLIRDKGIYRGEFIERWLRGLYKAKGKVKFKDIAEMGKSKLTVIAADITRREMLILPYDLEKYGIDPWEFDIARAVRMSIGIPLYFNPIKLNYKGGSSYIVDGGLISNYPIWIFDVKDKPRWPTFGFKLCEDKKTKKLPGNNDIISYLSDVIGTVVDKNEEVYITDKDNVRSINIKTFGIKATQFSISKNQCKCLYNEGYRAAQKFIDAWSFEAYVQKYRKATEL